MKTKTYMSNKWQSVEKVDHTPDFENVSHDGRAWAIMLVLVGVLAVALVNVDVIRAALGL